MKDTYKKELHKGVRSSKITSTKQALTRAGIHGGIFAIALFTPVHLVFKILIGVILLFIFGAIASSDRFIGKL